MAGVEPWFAEAALDYEKVYGTNLGLPSQKAHRVQLIQVTSSPHSQNVWSEFSDGEFRIYGCIAQSKIREFNATQAPEAQFASLKNAIFTISSYEFSYGQPLIPRPPSSTDPRPHVELDAQVCIKINGFALFGMGPGRIICEKEGGLLDFRGGKIQNGKNALRKWVKAAELRAEENAGYLKEDRRFKQKAFDDIDAQKRLERIAAGGKEEGLGPLGGKKTVVAKRKVPVHEWSDSEEEAEANETRKKGKGKPNSNERDHAKRSPPKSSPRKLKSSPGKLSTPQARKRKRIVWDDSDQDEYRAASQRPTVPCTSKEVIYIDGTDPRPSSASRSQPSSLLIFRPPIHAPKVAPHPAIEEAAEEEEEEEEFDVDAVNFRSSPSRRVGTSSSQVAEEEDEDERSSEGGSKQEELGSTAPMVEGDEEGEESDDKDENEDIQMEEIPPSSRPPVMFADDPDDPDEEEEEEEQDEVEGQVLAEDDDVVMSEEAPSAPPVPPQPVALLSTKKAYKVNWDPSSSPPLPAAVQPKPAPPPPSVPTKPPVTPLPSSPAKIDSVISPPTPPRTTRARFGIMSFLDWMVQRGHGEEAWLEGKPSLKKLGVREERSV